MMAFEIELHFSKSSCKKVVATQLDPFKSAQSGVFLKLFLRQMSSLQPNSQGEYDGGGSSQHSTQTTRHSYVVIWDGMVSEWDDLRVGKLEQALLTLGAELVRHEHIQSAGLSFACKFWKREVQ
jgi:hypothetical protein